MRNLFFWPFFFFVTFSHAQTVMKVTGSEALVNLSGQNLTIGNTVHFLTQSLAIAGQGEVIKVSAGGSKALIKITSGKVTAGMTLETNSPKLEKIETATTESSSPGVTYTSLTDHEREILRKGEISTTQYIIGGIVGTYPIGLGVGHAIQGRYTEKGWIFTAGEFGSLAAFLAGIGSCWHGDQYYSCNSGLAFAGIVGFVGFRIWEIIDVWAGPLEQNRNYREIKNLLHEDTITFQPALVPMVDGGMFEMKMTF